MSGLVAQGIEKSFGDRQVLRGCDLRVQAADRIGLVGANGSGKSTLLAILAGRLQPDAGTVERRGRLDLLDQDPELPGRTVGEAADEAVAWHRRLLLDYQRALQARDFARSAALHDELDQHGWEIDHRVDGVLSRLGAPPREAHIADLSGGERRRVALARALLDAPELLLLDEPTNHLDADTVEWLQGVLQAWRGAVILVTHDRYLLEAVADRIVEVEEGVCVPYSGSYADYLLARAERRAGLQKTQDRRLALIAREAAWASRSPAARSTKQKGRLQRLDALRAQRNLEADRDLSFDFRTGDPGGTVLELHAVSKGYGGRTLIDRLDLALAPGDRVGVLGPNGAGKSTLLRLIAGSEAPDSGELRRGSRIQVGILDQERGGLRPDDTVLHAAAGGQPQVTLGKATIHVAGFLQRFLFRRESFHQKVHTLSGGERARLLLANLMLRGCNLLLLDEPTNDLDLATLRVLEEALLGFDGSAVIVTHDRAFLDRVCTRVLAFEGEGRVVPYGDRLQHLQALRDRARAEAQSREPDRPPPPPAPKADGPKRLSFKERREFEALPGRIEGAEEELASLHARLADPATYQQATSDIGALNRREAELQAEIERMYGRWEELETRA